MGFPGFEKAAGAPAGPMEAAGRRVAAALIVAVFAVSFSAIFAKASGSHPLVLSAFRLTLAALVLLPFAGARRLLTGGGMNRQDLALTLLSGCILGLHYTLWFASLERTSVASAAVLVTIHPLLILPVSMLLFGERVRARGVIGLLLAFAGGVAIARGDLSLGEGRFAGDLLALLAAVAMGGYLLIGASLRRRVDLASYVALVYLAGGALTLAIAFVSGISLWPHPPREWLIFLGLALVPTLLGHTLFNWSLAHTGPTVVSASVLGEPIGAALLAFAFFHEAPGVWQAAGGAAILAGVYLFVTGRVLPGGERP